MNTGLKAKTVLLLAIVCYKKKSVTITTTLVTMALYIIVISLIITNTIAASSNCDQQNRIEKLLHPYGLPASENCCHFKMNHFDCSPSGIYKMKSWCGGQFSIVCMYCDTTTADGGWTVIQRRKDGSENFNRPWSDYENGFGDLNGEFWYGLKSISCFTQTGQWELRVDFQLTNGTRSYLHYNRFKVGSATEEYPLTIGGFTGITPTDPFGYHNGMKFTTYDNDNDQSSGNCAVQTGNAKGNGGWWYKNCWTTDLNLKYNPAQFGSILLSGTYYNPRWIEMKIRPLNCTSQ